MPDLSDDHLIHHDKPCEQNQDGDSEYSAASSSPQHFNQKELSDLIRELDLPKKDAELLASRLNDKHLLDIGTKISFYRKTEKDLLPFFSHEDNLVFCNLV